MTDRSHVLNMLADGKITPEQGAQLLSALSPAGAAGDRPRASVLSHGNGPALSDGRSPHWFHVRVSDLATGRTKVNLTIPLGLVKFGLQIGARFAPEVAGLDADEIVRALRDAVGGPLVDVQDDEDGEHVEIFVD